MALKDLQALFPLNYTKGGKNQSARKRGPGRYNKLRAYSRGKHSDFKKTGYVDGIESDARFDESGHTKQLSPATEGGNWQGKGFLSYSEHDAIARRVLSTTFEGERKAVRKFEENLKLDGKRQGR